MWPPVLELADLRKLGQGQKKKAKSFPAASAASSCYLAELIFSEKQVRPSPPPKEEAETE